MKNKRLQEQLVEAEQVVESPQKRVPLVRYGNRNLGMTPEFEGHVQNLMATGGSARQVRDNLVLNADHFLCESDSIPYKKDIPTEHWFGLQREALGVQPENPNLLQPHTMSLFLSLRRHTHLNPVLPRSSRTSILCYKSQPANALSSGGLTKQP